MKRKFLSLVLALSMAFSLVACGDSSSGNTAVGNGDAATEGASTGTSAAGDSGAASGRTLTVGANTAPQNISPFTNFTNRQPVVIYLYEKLMAKDSEGNYFGIIAKDWTTEDNITFDINIYDYVYHYDSFFNISKIDNTRLKHVEKLILLHIYVA